MWSREEMTFPKTGTVRDNLMVELGRLELVGTFHSMESGKGSEILEGAYPVTLRFEPDGWRFNIVVDNGGEVWVLRFDHSENYEYFYTDTGRGDDAHVELYKEMRLSGVLRKIGGDIPVDDRSRATLVLQGFTSTWCMEPSDFDHWILTCDVRRGDVVEHAAADGEIRAGVGP